MKLNEQIADLTRHRIAIADRMKELAPLVTSDDTIEQATQDE